MVKSKDIVALHDGAPAPADTPLWQAIGENHWNNCRLWEQEDLARRRHAPDAEIAGNKRAIDSHNQKRNDAIERIDGILLSTLPRPAPQARLSSETAGSMIDRLSIVSLKIKAMRSQTERTDVSREHIETCKAKLERLLEQRADLAGCLDRLLEEAARGESYFKVYRQFKMYNDPALNPAVYNERKA
jgi:hypothetical protein